MILNLQCAKCINYSLVATGYQHVIKFVTIPTGQKATVRLTGGFSVGELQLSEGDATNISPTLNANLFATLSYPMQAQLVISCSDGTETVRFITILPLSAWDQRQEYARVTAAFVLENDPFVLHIIRQAEAGPSPDGQIYNVQTTVERLYNQIASSFQVCYLYERGLWPEHDSVQQIRFPAQMHYDVGGTCIDLALLLAAVTLRAGLAPIILLLGEPRGYRHALVAVWNQAEPLLDPYIQPPHLYQAIKRNQLLIVEPTWFTQDKPFADATKKGWEQASIGPILWGIDVKTARYHSRPVHPLPELPCATILGGLPARSTDPYTHTRTAEASQLINNIGVEVVASENASDRGRTWVLSGYAIRIGRTRNTQVNAIALNDGTVSREHAVLFVRDGRFFIKDLASKNRSYIEDKALEPYLPYPIDKGQTFKVGEVVLRLN